MIKVEMHLHTRRSPDGVMTPQELFAVCRERGIGAVAVTDHDTFKGALDAAEEATDIKVIVSEEIESSSGEIIGYFLKKEIPRGLSAEETVSRIREQGGLVCIPHPFDKIRSSRIKPEALLKIITNVDIIEVFNARNIFNSANIEAISYAGRFGKAASAGSDAHTAAEVGRCWAEVEEFDGALDFLAKLRRGRIHSASSALDVHLQSKFNKYLKKLGLIKP